jgi:ComF family protein
MNRILITQVSKILSTLFWIDENPIKAFPPVQIFLRENWIISLYKYKNKVIKNAVWQMKYRANYKVAEFFGQKMMEILMENKAEIKNLEDYVLVPIPIHWRRRMERGFNQSDRLGKEIIRNFRKIKLQKVLKRVIYTKKQSWNNREDRQKNIRSVFKVRNKFQNLIAGRKFLLIDDVVTTGATLKEARHELLIHGASSVKALTIAC